jgi:hypothetical protein
LLLDLALGNKPLAGRERRITQDDPGAYLPQFGGSVRRKQIGKSNRLTLHLDDLLDLNARMKGPGFCPDCKKQEVRSKKQGGRIKEQEARSKKEESPRAFCILVGSAPKSHRSVFPVRCSLFLLASFFVLLASSFLLLDS